MNWKVMVSAPYMRQVIGRFQPIFEENNIELVLPPVVERLSEEELLNWVGDIDGAICGDDSFTERVLSAASRLKVISKWGTGIDSIDLAACNRLGIKVKNSPNAFSEPVADTTLGFILCFARNLLLLNQEMHSGIWCKRPSVSLSECTLGVIGVGNIGKCVVRRANAFGMMVVGNDLIDMTPEFLTEVDIKMVSLDDLLCISDFVSLNCDLNPTSRHLISDRELSLMKPTSVIINTARGPIIDEAALIRALRERTIAGAALDVFELEPLPQDSPLRRMDNVLLSPHNANSSPSAWDSVHYNTINNLLAVLTKEDL